MANKFRTKDWDSNFNLIVYTSIIFAGIGVAWLALNDIPAGIRYITILTVGVALLTITFLFVDEDNSKRMSKFIKIPFTTDLSVGAGFYLLGWMVPLLINLITTFFGTGFNISQLMIPLAGNQINNQIMQTLSVAQAQTNPFWQWFISVFTAGTIEEFVFGFILMFVGVMFGHFIYLLIWGKEQSDTKMAFWFRTIFALIFTGLIFGGAHGINDTYMGIMFLIAIGFRLVMNYSIYVTGVFITFTLGFHQANNAIWFWSEYGASVTIQAFQSIGGVLILIYFSLILYYIMRNIDTVLRKLRESFNLMLNR